MSLASTVHQAVETGCITQDGTRIVYEIHGDISANKRVVLIHSLAMDRRFWGPVVERLTGDATVLTYDCRGHGSSDKPQGPYSVERFADDLADVLDQIGWETALVAGASMGGSVALTFAIRHSARTSALGLFDTTAWYGSNAPQQWDERATAALQSGLASLIPFQLTRWFGDRFKADHPDVVQECVNTFLRNDIRAYAETCRMLGAFDLRQGMSSIRIPTAVVVGEEDYATPPSMAENLKKGIPGATLRILEQARHLTPLECPDQIVSELKALLRVSHS